MVEEVCASNMWVYSSDTTPNATVLKAFSDALFNCFSLTPQGTNWDDLARKAIPAPFIPRITNELDVSNFSDEFTRMIPTDSPAIVPPNFDKIFKVRTICLSHFAFSA